jgi:uncharacterized protein YbbK (DUF523 family)/uncharacterized protein YbgA (DUF1722 family)
VRWIPVCPEVEIGLGTPRPRIQLVQTSDGGARMIQQGRDITSRMEAYSRSRLSQENLSPASDDPICGYLFKARSPSCGIGDVRQLAPDGTERADGFGLFARAFRDRYPSVPIFDETALEDPYLREGAIAAFFTMERWHNRRARGGSLSEFHRAHRALLAAHDMEAVAELDRWLDVASDDPASYETQLSRIVQKAPDQQRHRRALVMLAEEFDRLLPPGGREGREARAAVHHLVSLYPEHADLAETIEKLDQLGALHAPALCANAYLHPHPKDLSLYRGL